MDTFISPNENPPTLSPLPCPQIFPFTTPTPSAPSGNPLTIDPLRLTFRTVVDDLTPYLARFVLQPYMVAVQGDVPEACY